MKNHITISCKRHSTCNLLREYIRAVNKQNIYKIERRVNNMRKNKESEITLSETKATPTQTPIEIALKIDENGMTTASQLYSFLELKSSNFARWCTHNIKNNKFATENVDYIPFIMQEERDKPKNPKPKTDYHLTSDFAKKLSMTGNSERHEQARDYFIACEQGLKIASNR